MYYEKKTVITIPNNEEIAFKIGKALDFITEMRNILNDEDIDEVNEKYIVDDYYFGCFEDVMKAYYELAKKGYIELNSQI